MGSDIRLYYCPHVSCQKIIHEFRLNYVLRDYTAATCFWLFRSTITPPLHKTQNEFVHNTFQGGLKAFRCASIRASSKPPLPE